MSPQSTPEAQALKRELESRGLIVEAEKWDGFKHIDLVVHRARLNIEVDGNQHYEDADQILSDLQRMRHSAKKGYDTIHIANAFINDQDHLRKVSDALAEAARCRAESIGHRLSYKHYAKV